MHRRRRDESNLAAAVAFSLLTPPPPASGWPEQRLHPELGVRLIFSPSSSSSMASGTLSLNSLRMLASRPEEEVVVASTAHRSGLAPNSIMLTCCQWESDGTDDDGDGHMLRGNGDRMLRCRLWLRWRSSLGSQSVGRRWLEATWSSHHILTLQPVYSLDSIECFCVTGQMSRWEEEMSPSGLFRCTGSTGPGSDPAQMPDAPRCRWEDVQRCQKVSHNGGRSQSWHRLRL